MALVEALAAVTEPMVLFWQFTTSVLAMLMPKKSVAVVFDVKVMDPIPVAAPMVANSQSTPRLQEYLVAHQAYAPSGAMVGGARNIRSVAASGEGR